MKVVLLKDIVEEGRPKLTIRVRKGFVQAWNKGETIDMSEASAQKYIERGEAVPFVEPEQEPEAPVAKAKGSK